VGYLWMMRNRVRTLHGLGMDIVDSYIYLIL
jgi:hypothetical protein